MKLPSPLTETTWRRGNAAFAPSAAGNAWPIAMNDAECMNVRGIHRELADERVAAASEKHRRDNAN